MRTTLNLLPPEKKETLRKGFIYAYVQTMLFILFIVAVFISGTLVGMRIMLTGVHQDLASRSTVSADTDDITKDIKMMNDYMRRLEGLQQRFVPWSKVLEKVTFMVPRGTLLDQFRIDRSGKLYITGTAATRDDVITFGKRLEQSGLFKEITSPLSNILQRENVKFDFEMRYSPDAN